MNIKVLENSLFWQQIVLRESKNKIQIERVKKNIEKLEQQIANLMKDRTK